MRYFVAIIIIVVLTGIFILSYTLNKKIKVPDVTEFDIDRCAGCSNTDCKKRVNNESEDSCDEKQ